MEHQIREDKILEFKALIMGKRTFDQLRELREHEGIRVIGWVLDGPAEYFIGQYGNTLVKVSRMVVFKFFESYRGREYILAEAFRLNVSPSVYINVQVDNFRDMIPQIFTK